MILQLKRGGFSNKPSQVASSFEKSNQMLKLGAQWLSGRVLYSRPKGRGFEPHWRHSIFTAEAKAIDLALDFISTCDANNKFIIFSDSLSVLKAMNHTSSKNPQIQKLLEKC